jgi:tRNA G18 (ribose-2'-O)-methylase SpoU
MARLIEISDPADDRVVDYKSLRDVQLRQSVETTHGLFIAEGDKVVRRSLEAGFEARSFLLSRRWLPSLQDLLDATDAPCYVVTDEIAELITGFHVHRGALASLARRSLPTVAQTIAHAQTLIVCEDIVDHTNVGAIFRSAAALGVDAVLISPRCADPLYRRSIKVSMGAVFNLPWTRLPDWYDALPALSQAGFTTVAMTLASDALALEDAVRDLDRVALVMGGEGHGLSDRWESTADLRAQIEMSAGIDSLNVAAATAVAAYVIRHRQMAQPQESTGHVGG